MAFGSSSLTTPLHGAVGPLGEVLQDLRETSYDMALEPMGARTVAKTSQESQPVTGERQGRKAGRQISSLRSAPALSCWTRIIVFYICIASGSHRASAECGGAEPQDGRSLGRIDSGSYFYGAQDQAAATQYGAQAYAEDREKGSCACEKREHDEPISGGDAPAHHQREVPAQIRNGFHQTGDRGSQSRLAEGEEWTNRRHGDQQDRRRIGRSSQFGSCPRRTRQRECRAQERDPTHEPGAPPTTEANVRYAESHGGVHEDLCGQPCGDYKAPAHCRWHSCRDLCGIAFYHRESEPRRDGFRDRPSKDTTEDTPSTRALSWRKKFESVLSLQQGGRELKKGEKTEPLRRQCAPILHGLAMDVACIATLVALCFCFVNLVTFEIPCRHAQVPEAAHLFDQVPPDVPGAVCQGEDPALHHGLSGERVSSRHFAGNTRQRGLLSFVIWTSLWCITTASVDPAVLNTLHDMEIVAEQRRLQRHSDRWDWVVANIGLPQPLRAGPFDLMLHRTTLPHAWSPPQQTTTIQRDHDAIDTVQAIEQLWPDLTPYTEDPMSWSVCGINAAIMWSQLPSNYEHMILISADEVRNNPLHVPLMVELKWGGATSIEILTTAMWLPRKTTQPSVLHILGLLRSCGNSHSCTMTHNAYPCLEAPLLLDYGDFLQIDGVPFTNPTIWEGIDPVAIPEPRPTAINATTYEGEESEIQQESEEDICIEPMEYVCHFVLHRATRNRHEPRSCHAITTHRNEVPREEVLTTWPDLRDTTWTALEVDPSYVEDFPQEGCCTIRVLRESQQRPEGREFISAIAVTWKGVPFTKAHWMPAKFNMYYVLQTLGFTHICGNLMTTSCKAYWNGHRLTASQEVDSREAQYIRVDIQELGKEVVSTAIDELFDVTSAANGYEQLDLPVMRYFVQTSGGTANDAVSHYHQSNWQQQWALWIPETTDRAPSTGGHDGALKHIYQREPQQCHDFYWIAMAWLLLPAAGALARMQIKNRYTGKCRRRMRRPTTRRGLPIRALIFASLILGADALAIHRIAPLPTIPTQEGRWLHRTHHPGRHLWRDNFDSLSPPGNPEPGYLVITPFGRRQLDCICTVVEKASPDKRHIQLYDALPPRVQLCLSEVLDVTDVDGLHATDNFAGTAATSAAGHVPYTENVEREVPKEHTPLPRSSQDMRVHSADVVHMPDRDPCHKATAFLHMPFDMNDTNDLIDGWECTPLPRLQDDEAPAHVRYTMNLPFAKEQIDKCHYIYTDGSFDGKTDTTKATWACVIYTEEDGIAVLRDWYADFVETDSTSTSWFGAENAGVRSAEATALIVALLYSLQAGQTLYTKIFSDALTVLNVARGQWESTANDNLMQNLRATYLANWTLRKDDGLQTKHVKSHTGIIGNEFADYLAVQVRLGNLPARPLPRTYERWFGTQPPHIQWAWLRFDELIRPSVMASYVDTKMIWTGPDPSKPINWLPSVAETTRTDSLPLVNLKCVQFNVCTLRKPGATAYLRQQLEHHRVHVAALQETRTPEPIIMDTNYTRIISPAHEGHGGCEIWLSRTLPIGSHDGQKVYIERNNVLVLHSDPELLIIDLTIMGKTLLIISAHAPHRAHQREHISQWWKALADNIQHRQQGRHVMCFIDANARVGSCYPWIGNVDEETNDTAGDEMLQICQQFNLKILNTFDNIHYGTSATWQGWQTQTKDTRIDYILTTITDELTCTGTWTDNCLDAGHVKLDHIPLFAQIAFQPGVHKTLPRPPKFDRDQMMHATSDQWQKFFSDWPHIPWNIPVTEHAAIIEQHLHEKLAEHFPAQLRHCRDSCFRDDTWKLHMEKLYIKKLLSQQKKIWDLRSMDLAFRRLQTPELYGPCPAATATMTAMAIRSASRLQRYKTVCGELEVAIKMDRNVQVKNMANDLAGCNAKEVTKFMRPLRMGRRLQGIGQHQLPMVNMADGTVAATHEAARSRWRQHFAQMESGVVTTPIDLALNANGGDLWEDMTYGDIPTIFEFETQLRKTKSRKACGLDGLPGELLKHAPTYVAYHVYPLLQKMSLWGSEPLQYKGGRLAVVHKKGSPQEVDHYRALLISSALGKSIHNTWRRRSIPMMRQFADPLQISAQQGALVAQAAHLVRLHMGAAKRQGFSSFVLFLDIKSAYYQLVRQHAMDLDNSDLGLVTLLHRLGIEHHIDEIAQALQEPSTLRQMDCPEPLHRMISTFHEQTWFLINNDNQIVETSRGTRPGDGFADVVWTLAYSRFIRRLTDRLHATGAFMPHHWNEQPGLLAADGDVAISGLTVTWADDTAVLGWHEDATSIVPLLRTTTEIVFAELARLGMSPNVSPGKTEAILDIRGPQSLACRQYLHGPCKSKIDLDCPEPQPTSLRIVPSYVHLGGILVQQGKHLAEIKRRIAMTLKSISTHRTKVYSNPIIDLEHRVSVFKASALLTLSYNIGTWSKLNRAESRSWTTGVFGIYRKLLSKLMPVPQQQRLTDLSLLELTGLPSPMVLLHIGRLRHYGLCLRRHTPFFWALTAVERDWQQLVKESFNWLYQQIQGLTSMPDPIEHIERWHDLIIQQPMKWKGLLKRAQAHDVGQTALRSQVEQFHKNLVTTLRQAGLTTPVLPTPHPPLTHKCTICNKTFDTFRGWAVHAFDTHQRVNRYRQLDSGTICRACGRQYPSNYRLVCHFRHSTVCSNTLAAQQLWPEPQPSFGSKEVAARRVQDSMIPWLQTTSHTLLQRHGWAMTIHQLALLRLLVQFDWDTIVDTPIAAITEFLATTPLHHTEVLEAINAMTQYHHTEHSDEQLRRLREGVMSIYTNEVEPCSVPDHDSVDPHATMDEMHYKWKLPPPRPTTRFLYVLHLFSGVKRVGDVHGFVAALPATPSGAVFCPISVDVALNRVHGDLLHPKTQRFWINKSRDGFIFFVL